MPKFRIYGADEQTAQDMTITIEADNAKSAELQAADRGVMISRIVEEEAQDLDGLTCEKCGGAKMVPRATARTPIDQGGRTDQWDESIRLEAMERRRRRFRQAWFSISISAMALVFVVIVAASTNDLDPEFVTIRGIAGVAFFVAGIFGIGGLIRLIIALASPAS